MRDLHKILLRDVLGDVLWPASWTAVALLAIVGLFLDQGLPGLPALGIAMAMVTGTTIVLLVLPRESIARALMSFASILITAIIILYVALDAILDPIFYPDWPIAIFATAVVIGVAAVLLARMADEL
jgi:hypothetical protein